MVCINLLCVCAFSVSVLRDISERGRELEQVLTQYITFVKPAFEEFCLPASDIPNTSHPWLCRVRLIHHDD